MNIYTDNTYTNLFYNGEPNIIEPYIMDNDINLTSLDMQYITIDSGNVTLTPNAITLYIDMAPIGSYYEHCYFIRLTPDSEFYNSGGLNGDYYEIPVSTFKNYLISGYKINFVLVYSYNNNDIINRDREVIYTPDLSNETDISRINNIITSNSNILNNNIKNQTNAIEENTRTQQETQDFLKNDSFDSNNLNLPSNNSQDITQDGINNIFNIFYNAFTSGQPPDIIIPIPFTNKSFTIQANFLQNILSRTQFNWIQNIISLFWWYIISVFIIKDISKKMNKIKSGDIENLENSNIKEDML